MKKKVKGMTLIEVIISLAVFAMLGLVLVTVGSNVDCTTRATNSFKEKMAEQSHYAANGVTDYVDSTNNDKTIASDSITIKINVQASGTYIQYGKDAAGNIDPSKTVKKTYNNPSVTLNAEQYNTEEVYTDGMTTDEKDLYKKRANHGLNFKFVKLT